MPTVTNTITIADTATLDVGGNIVGTRPVTVIGGGVGGDGAIVNSGASQSSAMQFVTLTNDTTFGGSGDWDIRSVSSGYLHGFGYKLTKMGTNQISLANLGETALADIAVNAGTLVFEGTSTMGIVGNTATVASGAALGLRSTGSNITNKNVVLNGGAFSNISGTNTFSGSIALDATGLGGAINVASGTLTLNGAISGGGNGAGLTKNGGGTLVLLGTGANWNDKTTIAAGTLQIGNGTTAGVLPGLADPTRSIDFPVWGYDDTTGVPYYGTLLVQ